MGGVILFLKKDSKEILMNLKNFAFDVLIRFRRKGLEAIIRLCYKWVSTNRLSSFQEAPFCFFMIVLKPTPVRLFSLTKAVGLYFVKEFGKFTLYF